MDKIYIVGAGGLGKELLQIIKEINEVSPTWEIGGFLDNNFDALKGVECDYRIVGRNSDWNPKEGEVFAMAIADPGAKELRSRELKEKGAVFPPIIHPTARITEFSHYGEGLIMFPYSKLSVNSTVGKFVTVFSSGVGHDVFIDDYTTLSGMCSILRNVRIGKRVFVGANAAIAQDVQVGDDAYIGIGSVVLKDVPAGMKTFGNPARFMPL
ncbi:MAG TPA: sugar O-acyltransferase [Lachnospiraceae bacterium]|nr:sugar O-acyltransferase [Lachnospiraceae bacterium]